MPTPVETLLNRIRALQDELDQEIARRGEAFRYRLHRGRVEFEDETRRHHRALRIRLRSFLAQTRPMVVLTAPLIYSLIVPFVLLDLCVSLYQAVCFRVYGIPRVRRADYIRIDRHHLQYLNALQKLNCVYCGYCNGLIAYVAEVAGRTEAYWCPIKHAARVQGRHKHYLEFLDYGDAEGFEDGLHASRRRITGKK